MNDPFQLVTNCNFKGKDYLVQMCVLNSKKLELIITDKIMAEDWQCEYDSSYIEALTHKTGNFKQFDVFVMMLRSGLLKTSESITLDLLTIDDLEQLRNKKIINSQSSTSRTNQSVNLNKRYLILTYSVEFDRIHYPLPLDYCGPPDPTILQSNIRRLETEIERLRQKNSMLTKDDEGDTKKYKEKIHALLEENKLLTQEIHRLKKVKPMKASPVVLKSLKKLEEQVLFEKTHNRQIIVKLKTENKLLKQKVEELKIKEKALNLKLKEASRVGVQKTRKRISRNSLSPENSLDRRRNAAINRLSAQTSNPALPRWNISSVNESHDLRSARVSQNKFLGSSSSESEDKNSHRPRSREKRSSEKEKRGPCKSDVHRNSSNEKSRHSSKDSKKNPQTSRSRFTAISQQEKSDSIHIPKANWLQTGLRSRDSSVSSRGSSKHSKVSRISNCGSGGSVHLKRVTPRAPVEENEDLKFTMSDLEARIHSLQKLLSEGINF